MILDLILKKIISFIAFSLESKTDRLREELNRKEKKRRRQRIRRRRKKIQSAQTNDIKFAHSQRYYLT